jgi:hypothetical protein
MQSPHSYWLTARHVDGQESEIEDTWPQQHQCARSVHCWSGVVGIAATQCCLLSQIVSRVVPPVCTVLQQFYSSYRADCCTHAVALIPALLAPHLRYVTAFVVIHLRVRAAAKEKSQYIIQDAASALFLTVQPTISHEIDETQSNAVCTAAGLVRFSRSSWLFDCILTACTCGCS